MLPSKTTLTSKGLTVDDRNISGSFPYATVDFSFVADITVTNNSPWSVSIDSYGMQNVATKIVPLSEGNNTFYIHVTNPDQTVSSYTVNLYRNHLYTVTFDTKGGTSVEPQQIEEGYLAEEPSTSRAGYTFASWDHDFNTPITDNITVNANWNANGDTPYTVEYYRENVDKNYYELIESETETPTGQTDTTAYATEKTFDHFTLNTSMSILSGNIDGEGTLVLRVYYTRDTYTVRTSSNTSGNISGTGTYAYGKLVTTLTAKIELKQEMSNFNFTSTATTCQITGIKDKTVTEIIVPDYVTSISRGAFSGCSSLQNITLPFVGESKKTSSDTYQYPFGYIFGTSSYTGGT